MYQRALTVAIIVIRSTAASQRLARLTVPPARCPWLYRGIALVYIHQSSHIYNRVEILLASILQSIDHVLELVFQVGS